MGETSQVVPIGQSEANVTFAMLDLVAYISILSFSIQISNSLLFEAFYHIGGTPVTSVVGAEGH